MTSPARIWLVMAAFLFPVLPVHAEYLHIELRVYGLDCELCARGVSASVNRLAGVKSVNVSLKTGMLEIELVPGNRFKMSDLRKRIKENGFRSMDATVTAVGQFDGPRFEVVGSGDSYAVGGSTPRVAGSSVLTFHIPRTN